MNQRIRELVKQSGGIYHNDDGDELTPALVGKGIEKFTELIVRDCINQIRGRKEIAIENNWNVDESMTIVEVDIEDWFGIDDDEQDD